MEKQDLDQIRGVVKEEFVQGFQLAFASIWEHNLEPTLTQMQGQISQLPTKAYLDQKIADLKGDVTLKIHKTDDKVNRLTEVLKQKELISQSDI